MAPIQLSVNQGAEDSLIIDNSRSYFKHIGYSRTSNFAMELRDIDPISSANLGANVTFNIPKAADMLGPIDLMVDFKKLLLGGVPAVGVNDTCFWGWVENLGYAMIDKATFQIGTHDIETLTGEDMNIINELMRSDTHRYGYKQTLKTGRPLVRGSAYDSKATVNNTGSTGTALSAGGTVGVTATDVETFVNPDTDPKCVDRLIAYKLSGDQVAQTTIKEGKKLCIPLNFFWTGHPSKYFPICAIAGVNDVRVTIRFKPLADLLMCFGAYKYDAGVADGFNLRGISTTAAPDNCKLNELKFDGSCIEKCYLRCQYIHLTGPEATSLMNAEHPRIMKLYHGNHLEKQFSVSCSSAGTTQTLDMDLSFLHPVTELIITIRKVSDMGATLTNATATGGTSDKAAANTAQTKNYFAYHGSGVEPNPEYITSSVDGNSTVGAGATVKVKTFNLKCNGQTFHLDGAGIDRDYLMDRLMPTLHSNTDDFHEELLEQVMEVKGMSSMPAFQGNHSNGELIATLKAMKELKGRKEIYTFPFSIAPEGQNPAGHLNFSKVSHAKLSITVDGLAPGSTTDDFQVDVYGVYYNWMVIKDGRALLSFA